MSDKIIIEYKIVKSGYPEDLAKEVTAYLKKDYHLYGSLVINSSINAYHTYIQTMVKYQE